MLKWLAAVNGWFGRTPEPMTTDPDIIPRDQHCISRRDISRAALKVMAQLRDQGYQAYLVGGGVRDLLLGGHPKDFDVATNATPEQVRQLFRGSRIIGRRFQIVHVRFGREIIEVTTFRGHHQAGEPASRGRRPGNAKSARSQDGMLLRDNVYGSMEDDAYRRDFTVNALYYCAGDFSLYDYTGGMKDLEARKLQMIGEPAARYREDPVRMLRAIRFAAKLDFAIAEETAAPIHALNNLITAVPAARLFDEVLKLFMHGHARRTWQLLLEYGLFQPLFPASSAAIEQDRNGHTLRLIEQAMTNTDRRIAADKPVTPAFIFAALLWPAVAQRFEQLQQEGVPPVPAMHQAAQQVLSEQQSFIAIPRRFSMITREIWELQLRLQQRRRAEELMTRQRFRAGYDFLLLREEAGEPTEHLAQWWTRYQEADDDSRQQMLSQLPSGNRRPRKRKPRYRNNPTP